MKKKKILKTLLIVYLILNLILLAYVIYEDNHLVTTVYEYSNDKITDELEGFTIVQISDLHAVSFGKNNKRLIEEIKKQNPDIIVITGDIVDSNISNKKVAYKLISETSKICDVYYVTGNHEYNLSDKNLNELLQGIRDAGAIILDNKAVEISSKGDSLILYGLDDNSLYNGTLQNLVEQNDDNKLSVLLAHEPQWLNKYASNNMDLVFVGHAHGGQVKLPFVGAIVAPDQGFFPELAEGVHVKDKTTMVISRGLGYTVIPVRFLNPPELVVVKFAK